MSKTVKPGDRISVTFEANVRTVTDRYIIIGDSYDDRKKIYMGVNTDAAEMLKILPRDLKVGDAVIIQGYLLTGPAVIKAIADGQALIKWDSGTYSTFPVTQLKLKEGCDC